jgi:transposase
MARHGLTDEQWAKLQPHLPGRKPGPGRPPKDDRLILDALLWLARTGAPWRDLPDEFGPWRTVYSRFRRWREAGVWEQLFQRVLEVANDGQPVKAYFVDGSTVRAHQHAAGAKGGSPDTL